MTSRHARPQTDLYDDVSAETETLAAGCRALRAAALTAGGAGSRHPIVIRRLVGAAVAAALCAAVVVQDHAPTAEVASAAGPTSPS